MKKSTMAIIFICLLSLASLSVVLTSANDEEEEILVTKNLWRTFINGTAVTSQTMPDLNDDGHADVLVASKAEGSGYLTLIDGKDGSTIRKISLDYEPTEVLYVQESDRIAVAKRAGGVGIYDTQLNLNCSIPSYHPYGLMYHAGGVALYFVGKWIKKQADWGINPPGMYPENNFGTTENWGYIGEVDVEFMEEAANQPAPDTWDPYKYMLDVKMNRTPAPYEYAPICLQTFDGTDLVYCDGYYGPEGGERNNTHFVSHSIMDGSLNWREGGISVPGFDLYAWYIEQGEIPPPVPIGTSIVLPIFQVVGFTVLSPTRGVGYMRTIGVAGMNFSGPSHLGEWPLLLIDNHGGWVEQYTIYEKTGEFGTHCFYATAVENSTYERHFVTPLTPWNETHFSLTITSFEASVLMCYHIAYDNFTIVWKTPIDRGDMNRGFLIEDLNDDGAKELIAVKDENVTVFSSHDGSKLYTTDLSTFSIVDVAHLSLGDVILTTEGEGYLLSFGSSNHTTYWKQYFGTAWETYMSPMQDVDGDDRTDLVVATESNVTCYWGYYETYIPPGPPPPPIQEELWFWTVIAVVLDAVVIGLVAFARRRSLRKEAAATA